MDNGKLTYLTYLEKIKKMGMLWWSEFGDRAIKFLNSN